MGLSQGEAAKGRKGGNSEKDRLAGEWQRKKDAGKGEMLKGLSWKDKRKWWEGKMKCFHKSLWVPHSAKLISYS